MLTARPLRSPTGCVVRGGALGVAEGGGLRQRCMAYRVRVSGACHFPHADPQPISDRHGVRCTSARPSHADSSPAYEHMLSVDECFADGRACACVDRSGRAKTLLDHRHAGRAVEGCQAPCRDVALQ